MELYYPCQAAGLSHLLWIPVCGCFVPCRLSVLLLRMRMTMTTSQSLALEPSAWGSTPQCSIRKKQSIPPISLFSSSLAALCAHLLSSVSISGTQFHFKSPNPADSCGAQLHYSSWGRMEILSWFWGLWEPQAETHSWLTIATLLQWHYPTSCDPGILTLHCPT